MVDYRTGRRYVELLVERPEAFRGWMRIYTDRVVKVQEFSKRGCSILWRRAPSDDEKFAVWLDVHLPARDVIAMVEKA